MIDLNCLYDTQNTVKHIKNNEKSTISYGEFVLNSRYPYTYAYDFVRHFYKEFGFDKTPSRGEVASLITSLQKEEIVRVLAKAYFEILL